ncbi:MAG: hypothetical protein IKR90_07320 [Clostridia bacterium]|nr:hypothetical protein [Clostridia bacterium]
MAEVSTGDPHPYDLNPNSQLLISQAGAVAVRMKTPFLRVKTVLKYGEGEKAAKTDKQL